jgi:hypothetical protein
MDDEHEENPVTEKVVGPLAYQVVMVVLMVIAGIASLGLKLLAKLWGVDKSAE